MVPVLVVTSISPVALARSTSRRFLIAWVMGIFLIRYSVFGVSCASDDGMLYQDVIRLDIASSESRHFRINHPGQDHQFNYRLIPGINFFQEVHPFIEPEPFPPFCRCFGKVLPQIGASSSGIDHKHHSRWCAAVSEYSLPWPLTVVALACPLAVLRFSAIQTRWFGIPAFSRQTVAAAPPCCRPLLPSGHGTALDGDDQFRTGRFAEAAAHAGPFISSPSRAS